MSYRSQLCLAASPAIALALAVSLSAAPPVSAGKSGEETARLATYEKAAGERFFALALLPRTNVEKAKAHDVVVLVDTSASQTNFYRQDSLAAAKALLAGLGEHDRVKLFAVDVLPVALNETFVSPTSAEAVAALAKLERRVPLGSTDMVAALEAAGASFAAKSADARAIVYIGDGLSKASLVAPTELEELLKGLVARRAPVTSFAIGPQRDVQLLATVANHTGGMVILDDDKLSATDAGTQLAKFAVAPVLWPTATRFSSAVAEVFPRVTPPLRTDRDSILIGTLSSGGAQQVAMTAELNGKAMELNWKVSTETSSDDFAFLPKMVELARKDDGVSLPTVGSAGLIEVSRVMLAGAQSLSKLSSQALATGDRDGAKRLAEAALKLDPESSAAAAIRRAAEKADAAAKEPVKPAPAAKPAVPKIDAGASLLPEGLEPAVGFIMFADDEGALLKAFEEEEGKFLGSVEDAKAIITGKIRAEVEDGLTQARKKIGSSAESAKAELKLLLENVERAVDLEADIRAQLRDQIESALKEASRREIEESEKRANNEEARAAALERQLLVEETARKDAKIKQLMDRFNSLMDEGRYEEAESNIAEQVRTLDPDRPYSEATVWYARNKGNVLKMYQLREHRHKNFVDALYMVEKAHVPFPDDPPIVYPDAEVWEELTLRRKKYSSMDLAKQGSAETKILAALNDSTTLEFIETPLKDVVDYLKDLHGIEIQIDTKALDGVGVSSDTPVTRNLKGVSLRSALRLMLKDLDLTYMVRDEVLQITTPEIADNSLVTKVYPVGDLVLPIQSQSMANPFMLGGGMGGMGGFGGGMGGMGGGMGGMGGGMGGMGGMGGGMGGMGGMGMGMGGFMAVADEVAAGEKPAPSSRATATADGPEFPEAFVFVEDDLRLGVKKPDTAPKVEKPAVQRPTVEKPTVQKQVEGSTPAAKTPVEKARRIQIAAGADGVDEAWARHFAEHVESPGSIRLTVRELMFEKKFDDAIALLHGALRAGQPHPWMYEALALAVQTKYVNDPDAGKPELERALLSAVDFSESLDDMMFVALYMTRVGLDERALKLFQKISLVNPTRPEPYMQGLEAAKRLDNVKGLEWACAGILGQAWHKDQRKIFENALRVAEATVLRLTMEQRLDEAKQFRATMNQALVRDCFVIVTWTGDADVDVLVEEPSGTVCSFRNPRTAGGGVMLGDTFSRPGKATTEGYSEVYACPQGFSGEYKILLKRVWGKVTAGKVTVDVYVNHRTQHEKRQRQQIVLGDNAMVKFELKEGRRQEPIEDLRAVAAAESQVAISRAILTQQLSAAEHSQATAAYAKSVGAGAGAGGVAPRGARPGVGFRPVITTLPEGANLTATAVVSADRRYVRITATPLFSQIGTVSTFNFATGGTGCGQGGGGGQGMAVGGGVMGGMAVGGGVLGGCGT